MIPQWLKLMPKTASASYKDICTSLGITRDSLRYLVRSNKFPQPDVHTNSGLNVDCSRSRWSREPLLRYYRNM